MWLLRCCNSERNLQKTEATSQDSNQVPVEYKHLINYNIKIIQTNHSIQAIKNKEALAILNPLSTEIALKDKKKCPKLQNWF
jgi:hypothetical protein